jgi:Protein of unknown function (DUF2840)
MSDLTHVELLWLEKRIERWIRFGRIAEEHVIQGSRRVVSFAPGSIFACVRWATNGYGTAVSRLDILRAVMGDQPHSTVSYVRPGAQILLRVSGWPKVERVLKAIDAIEGLEINPVDVCPDHWQHLHNRIAAGEEPHPYTPERHGAWLLRRSVKP